MSGNKSLHDKLEAAKEKASIREFEVTITETFQMKVIVEAKDQAEAEQIVSDRWDKDEYLIDAEHFVNANFDAAPLKPERLRCEER